MPNLLVLVPKGLPKSKTRVKLPTSGGNQRIKNRSVKVAENVVSMHGQQKALINLLKLPFEAATAVKAAKKQGVVKKKK